MIKPKQHTTKHQQNDKTHRDTTNYQQNDKTHATHIQIPTKR